MIATFLCRDLDFWFGTAGAFTRYASAPELYKRAR